MPRWAHAIKARLPRATAIWAALCLWLCVGLGTTLLDIGPTMHEETRSANSLGQRTIIDAVTGLVASSAPADKEAAAFEVAPEEESTPAPAPEAPQASVPPAADTPQTPPAQPEQPAPAITIEGPALRTEAIPVGLPDLPPTREAIVAPPAPEVTEQTDAGLLPKRGKEAGTTPSSLYAKRFQRHQEKHAYITFLLTDLGFNNAVLAPVLDLPKEVTLAFSPYALDPKPQIVLAHDAGFETWGMLPAQGSRYPQDDPGPLGIVGGQQEREQKERLHQVMAATLGAVGLVLPPDEVVTQQKDFARVLHEIDQRGLLLLSTHPQRSAASLSANTEMQKIIRRADLVLDSTDSTAFIQSKLAGLDALAKTQKKLIVVASARPHVVEALQAWFKKHPYTGQVRLAPLSAMYGPDNPPPPPEDEKKPAAASKKGGH